MAHWFEASLALAAGKSLFRAALAKYSPDQPRDDHGRWTDGGGYAGTGVEFVSPSIRDIGFPEAHAALGGERQRLLSQASAEVDHALGLSARDSGVIGAWADGAENSLMTITHGASMDELRTSAAMKGWLGDQKAVLVFQADPKGESVLATFRATGNLADIHASLIQDGVSFHTIQPVAGGARVYAVLSDAASRDAFVKGAERYGVHGSFVKGNSEFVGATDWGSETARQDAKSVYRGIIESSGVGRGTSAWSGIRDRWGPALAAVKKRLNARYFIKFYDPDEPRDDQGQWTDGVGDTSSSSGGGSTDYSKMSFSEFQSVASKALDAQFHGKLSINADNQPFDVQPGLRNAVMSEIARLGTDYPLPKGYRVQFTMQDELIGGGTFASTSFRFGGAENAQIMLNPQWFSANPGVFHGGSMGEALAADAASGFHDGMNDPKFVVAHEYAHVMQAAFAHEFQIVGNPVHDAMQKFQDLHGAISRAASSAPAVFVTGYARTNPSEAFAEAFAAIKYGDATAKAHPQTLAAKAVVDAYAKVMASPYMQQRKYSEDQPRDDHGRWTVGDASGNQKIANEIRTRVLAENKKLIGDTKLNPAFGHILADTKYYADWRDWYARHTDLVQTLYGPKNAETFARFLAASSVNNSVTRTSPKRSGP